MSGGFHYLDSSALIKLIVEEPESEALELSLEGAVVVLSSELALTEVPRAISRIAFKTSGDVSGRLDAAAVRLLRRIDLVPVSRQRLLHAGSFEAPLLRSLDAIHLACALTVGDWLDAFTSYDERQLQAAVRAGLPVISPSQRS